MLNTALLEVFISQLTKIMVEAKMDEYMWTFGQVNENLSLDNFDSISLIFVCCRF